MLRFCLPFSFWLFFEASFVLAASIENETTTTVTAATQQLNIKEAPPEASSQRNTDSAISSATGESYMVVTANIHASRAAEKILQQGGNALDAAIAAQMMLGLVEPQSSGIGGGAFLLYWNNEKQGLSFYDGRETAPAAVDENYFLNLQNQPLNFYEAIVGAYSVGVPGLLAMLDMAHKEQGSLDWSKLFVPAINTATQGFTISPRLHTLIKKTPQLSSDPTIKNYLFDTDGHALNSGTLLKNPAYAHTLETIATQGANSFYSGDIADAIISAVQNDPRKAGLMTLKDLKNYRAKKRPALCRSYRQYNVCGAGPPSSGASTILSILGILEYFSIADLKPDSSDFIHLFSEASNLAFADRNTYLADNDFVKVPLDHLLDKQYLLQQAKKIKKKKNNTIYPPGLTSDADNITHLSALSPELPSTTHISIVDSYGNAVSMTSSIENAFGGRLMVDGFFLNNQLSDFSFNSTDKEKNQQIANRIEPNKRPRSSMAPSIVFGPQGNIFALTGSPGGSRIIDYTALSIIHLIDWQHSPIEAVSASHIIARNNKILELEQDRFNKKTTLALKLQGHTIQTKVQSSGLHIIKIDNTRPKQKLLYGAADPRREGVTLTRKSQ